MDFPVVDASGVQGSSDPEGSDRPVPRRLLETMPSPADRPRWRLLWGTPRQRVCTLLLIGFKLAFCVSVLIYWHVAGEPGAPGRLPAPPVDVPCPPLGSPGPTSGAPAEGTIFFLETSGSTDPSFLFACSVESAARAHPERRVAVLMRGLPPAPPAPARPGLAPLRCFPNVRLRPLELGRLFRGTPLAAWHAAGPGLWEPHRSAVLSDAARLALLWKAGGVYLDTDVIVLRSLRPLRNALGAQSRYVLNGAVLAFERRHPFLALCMRDFVAGYNAWVWGHQGPQLLTRVFKRWCGVRSLRERRHCRGVTALPRQAFYPVPWQRWRTYFEDVDPAELPRLLNASYAAHVWNKKSQGASLEATSRALLAQLYARYCPTTHAAMQLYSASQTAGDEIEPGTWKHLALASDAGSRSAGTRAPGGAVYTWQRDRAGQEAAGSVGANLASRPREEENSFGRGSKQDSGYTTLKEVTRWRPGLQVQEVPPGQSLTPEPSIGGPPGSPVSPLPLHCVPSSLPHPFGHVAASLASTTLPTLKSPCRQSGWRRDPTQPG
ncbi:lactosylceramide 4-alpha-galactosyltransferase [Ctenodactylus gundi]